MEERGLVELAREGRADAYAELVRTYQSKVFNMAYGFTGNRESADDLTQEVFLKAYLALPRFRFGSSFGTWLYRIAVNHIKDFLRKKGKVREVSLEAVGEPAAAGDAFAALEDEREDERKRRLVRRELAAMPEKYRIVLTLRDVEGLPYEEIARVLGLSPGTLDSRLHRARKMLRTKVAPVLLGPGPGRPAPALGREGEAHEMP
jgi:RNA polymerase sigma-70 factor (ECF subfamily)